MGCTSKFCSRPHCSLFSGGKARRPSLSIIHFTWRLQNTHHVIFFGNFRGIFQNGKNTFIGIQEAVKDTGGGTSGMGKKIFEATMFINTGHPCRGGGGKREVDRVPFEPPIPHKIEVKRRPKKNPGPLCKEGHGSNTPQTLGI